MGKPQSAERKAKLREGLLSAGFGTYLASTLVSMAAMSIGAAVFLACLAYSLGGAKPLWDKLKETAREPAMRIYLWLAATLAAACALSLVSGLVFPLGYGGKSVSIHLGQDLPKLWYLVWPLPLVAGWRALGEAARVRTLRTWLLFFGLISVIGIAQFFTGWPRPQLIPGTTHFHATMFLGHHLSTASIWIFPFFICLEGARRGGLAERLGLPRGSLATLAALSATTLMLTWSRTLWVALPAAVLVWAWLSLPRKVSASVTVALAIAMAAASQHPVIQQRYADGYGLMTRMELWKANLEFLKQRPVLGVGWRHNNELSGYYLMNLTGSPDVFSGHAHNNVLDFLAGTGGAGTLAWLAWCVGILWLLYRPAPPSALRRALLCAWIAFHINGLTQLNFWEGKVTHQMMIAVALGLAWRDGSGPGESV